jgi:putative addiction module component (TIGR02574 family)
MASAEMFKESTMSLRDEIAQQALSLDAADRIYVADVLEQSLAAHGFATADINAAWSGEIDRRIAAYDRGEVEAADFETALARIRQRVADRSVRLG